MAIFWRDISGAGELPNCVSLDRAIKMEKVPRRFRTAILLLVLLGLSFAPGVSTGAENATGAAPALAGPIAHLRYR